MKTILVVDDSPTIRRLVMVSLERLQNVQFDHAANGLEAIERLAIKSVDLVILDLNIPDLHGLEVLKFVRTSQKYREIPIIILTTRSDDDTRRAMLLAGASVFLTKPFQPETLVAEARQLLGI